MSEKTTHFSSHFENKNFYITENDIGDLDLFFMLKTEPDGVNGNFKTHKVKIVREPIFYFSVSNSTPTSPIFSLGSKGVVGYSKGSPVYAGRIITNAFHNMPLINLLVESGIDSGEPTDLPPLDFYIVNKRRKSLIADETNVFQDCMVENLKILDWNFEQGIDTPGRFFVFNFIATGFKGIHLKNYLASQLYNTSGKNSLTPDLSNFSYDLEIGKTGKNAKNVSGAATSASSEEIASGLLTRIRNLTTDVISDKETKVLVKSFNELKTKFSDDIKKITDNAINVSLNSDFSKLGTLLDERKANDENLKKVTFNKENGNFDCSKLTVEEQKKIKVSFSSNPINGLEKETFLISIPTKIPEGCSFKMYYTKDSSQFSDSIKIEMPLSLATNHTPGIFISLKKAFEVVDGLKNNAEVINFFNENEPKKLLVGKINEKGDFVPNEDFNSIVAVGKIKDTYPKGYPKLGFSIAIEKPNQAIENNIKKLFSDENTEKYIKDKLYGQGYVFDFQYNAKLTGDSYDNSVSIILYNAFSHLKTEDELKTMKEANVKTVSGSVVSYKYSFNQEKELLNGLNESGGRAVIDYFRKDELVKIEELKKFIKREIEENNKKVNVLFSFYTCNYSEEKQKPKQLENFIKMTDKIIADFSKTLASKANMVTFSRLGEDKSKNKKPTLNVKKSLYVKGDFPVLYDGNKEFDDKNKLIIPKLDPTGKNPNLTEKKYKELFDSSGGAGTRLMRMVTVKISEVK